MASKKEWVLPRIEKIPEAYSAIADERVVLYDGYARVSSSDYAREYTITWDDQNTYTSNDNASYYHGNLGYPVIAVLMKQGKIIPENAIVDLFKGINWKELNTKNKNKYDVVVQGILDDFAADGKDVDVIRAEFEKTYDQLKTVCGEIKYKRSKLPPPK